MLERGFLKEVVTFPGVYIMWREKEVLYVGKARNLKRRLSSYFREKLLLKTKRLMEKVERIETIVTRNEKEALLLESNLIKRYLPPYNVVFKDDRSYPYLVMTDHPFPQLKIMRGKFLGKRKFGPFPDAKALKVTHEWLQKIFQLRTCNDLSFKYKDKPCLLYQIQLCSAPCVGKITEEEYRRSVELAVATFSREAGIIEQLTQLMNEAAKQQEYEKAIVYRNQIENYHNLQVNQAVVMPKGDLDVMAYLPGKIARIDLLKVRNGLVVGNQLFIAQGEELSLGEEEENFIVHYYEEHETPSKLLTDFSLSSLVKQWLQTEKKIRVIKANNTQTRNLLALAKLNGEKNSNEANENIREKGWQQLADYFKAPKLKRLEGMDISHYAGEGTVASWIIWTKGNFSKRSFVLEEQANDLLSLQKALQLRFMRKSKKEWPDLILIDGGEQQLKAAAETLKELGINLFLLAIAKGENRKEGLETIWTNNGIWKEIPFEAFQVLVKLRNLAHHKAITRNRQLLVNKRLKPF